MFVVRTDFSERCFVRIVRYNSFSFLKNNFCHSLSGCDLYHMIAAIFTLPFIIIRTVTHAKRDRFFWWWNTYRSNPAALILNKFYRIIISTVPCVNIPSIIICIVSSIFHKHIMFLRSFLNIRYRCVCCCISVNHINIYIFRSICIFIIYCSCLPCPFTSRILCNNTDIV